MSREQILQFRHSVKEQILEVHSVKEHILVAQCQGANFYETQCQGAYAGDDYTEFKNRIGKETELKTMQFAGELDEEAIENIEEAKNYLGDRWYQKMQKIIEENKGKKADYTIPEGIITDRLADNAENRAIAEKNWEKLEKIKEKKEKLKEKLWGGYL